ncbi:hypothetical protein SAMN05444716_1271 [Streptomyces harbinensis]|uniref:Uncharacterized protein n=2 Tax=Streptomyces TaxID=1883 RepID=A0A1I6WEA4_9ACTN|nr:hypothetical protein SAMN05444716_1271 [Streptomyces harbinensis]
MIDLDEKNKLNDTDSLVGALESYMDGRIAQIEPQSYTFS